MDPSALGRPVLASALLRTDSRGTAVAERLSRTPNICWVRRSSDERTVAIQLSTAGNVELARVVKDAIISDPDVTGFSTAIVLRSWAPHFAFDYEHIAVQSAPDLQWYPGNRSVASLDALDLDLLECLTVDAQMSLTDMSKVIGLSVAGTRHRLIRLMDSQTIHFRTRPDPHRDDVTTIRVEAAVSRDVADLAEELVNMPNVVYVSELTGARQLCVELVCANEPQISEGYARMASVQGIHDTHMLRLKTVDGKST
ncbi:AsnC family transcriptional regulator [Protaetiibacter intestinalis]|uniref:AsnC family transcriptional regulator n=1 Tax=Protaetiibacter intestinalis TaxID=2419774 RepID=UPI0013003E25|nr:AsnC family transcriptional regulator [Protaetiibacter intestinalis]